MKTAVAFGILAAAVPALAQAPSNLPCYNVCYGGMGMKAVSEFGCKQGDLACYCSKPQYGSGIVDCSNAACGSSQNAQSVISYASAQCSGWSFAAETFFSLTDSWTRRRGSRCQYRRRQRLCCELHWFWSRSAVLTNNSKKPCSTDAFLRNAVRIRRQQYRYWQ